MKVLVTGGAGYIGSHTCVELLNAGHEVVIIDNFVNSKPESLESIRKITGKDFAFVEADLRDRARGQGAVRRASGRRRHPLRGAEGGGRIGAETAGILRQQSGRVLRARRGDARHGVKKLVFSSSATVYGMNNPVPFREEMPTSATNPYGYTKVMIEQMLRDLAHADPEWSIVLLRYFNPIGAHASGLIGEDPNGIPNNLLPYVAQVAPASSRS